MPLFSAKRHPDGAMDDILVLTGTPDEVNGEEGDFIAGFSITGSKPGGKHDGFPAHIITLADDMGAREIGRLVVRTDVPFYKEECLEWERQFESPEAATAFLKEWDARADVYTSTQDFAFEESSVDAGIAAVSAKYGISITVLDENAGGGWPSVRLTGLRANLKKALIQGWGYLDEASLTSEMTRLG